LLGVYYVPEHKFEVFNAYAAMPTSST